MARNGHAECEAAVIVERGHNLPAQLTSFVGRDDEVAAVGRLVETNRLVTLTGSGGVGKTRLALRVASEVAEAFAYPDGVWLVELAGLIDAILVPQAVVWALKAREAPGRSLDETLLETLVARRLLLVMDNCEHLIDACARLIERLLSVCPELHVLATSREALGVPGETAWRVPSLPVPNSTSPGPPVQLMNCASVRLLVERTRAAVQSFTLTPDNSAAVISVCRRLDGIPLALELAAARMPVLSAEQLAKRLGDVFRILTAGTRTAVPRQKTLWATIDWSYELLSDTEKVLFRRSGVFAGGWTLEAAESVCMGAPIEGADVLDLLAQLVAKSLVLAEEHGGVDRYRLLEPVRQFAVERLAASDEATTVRDRHLDWLVGLAERAEAGVWGPEQVGWLERLEVEHDNVRAALEWGRISGQGEAMLRLASALARFWDVRGFLSEGYGWLAAALEAAAPLRIRPRAQGLARAGYLAVLRNDLPAAQAHLAQALELADELKDEETSGAALMIMGMVARAHGDYQQAALRFEESLVVARRVGHRPGIYTALYLLASAVRFSGDYQRAVALHEESLALKREQGDAWSVAASLFSLGSLARVQGDDERAAALYRESLVLRWQLTDREGICVCLEGLARLAAERHAVQAATLLGAAERLREVIGQVRRHDHADDRLIADLRSALGEETFSIAWGSGRDLPLERAIQQALALQEPVSAALPAVLEHTLMSAASPATGDPPLLTGPMDELRIDVEGALRHLNDLPTLSQHTLLGRTPSTLGLDRPAAEAAALLRGDLVQAIERLRPATPRPTPGSSAGPGGWLHFLVLYEAYVEGRPNKQIRQRYYLSEGTFHRARRRAIDTLARDLAQRTSRPSAGDPAGPRG